MWKENDSENNGKGLACLCPTISVESITQENVASSVSDEKKKLFVAHRKKKRTQIALILRRLEKKKSKYFG